MSQLLSVKDAQIRLSGFFTPKAVEKVPLTRAFGRVLGETIYSDLDLPLFPNASMDGFALREVDIRHASQAAPVGLQVIADIPAGQESSVVIGAGQAARIMTGAPIPQGADCVIPIENTDFHLRQAGIAAPPDVQIFVPGSSGENIRPKGQDVQRGEMVMAPGRRLRAQDIGFLAMLGLDEVPVIAEPRIAIFSTGDELVPVGEELTPGKIHDSNTYTLIALIEEAGGKALRLGIARDSEEEVRACLERAAEAAVDLILSSAGVSVGAFDFVRSVVEQEGHLEFWRVNMRPGKPLVFGDYRGIPFVGLPGNPVSSFVGFEVFVKPALARLAGLLNWKRDLLQVQLQEALESDGRESYLRAVVTRQEGQLSARLTGHQGSGNLRSLVQANALLVIPSGVKSLPAGSQVDAWMYDEIESSE